MTASQLHRHRPAYSERLFVPLSWWLFALVMVASFWLALIVATPPGLAWSATALAAGLVAWRLFSMGSAKVVVDQTGLHVGRAQISWQYVASAQALSKPQTRELLGPTADARAFLATKPYLSAAVHVMLSDPRDPTPYWLVSSRDPARLARAIEDNLPAQPSPHHNPGGHR